MFYGNRRGVLNRRGKGVSQAISKLTLPGYSLKFVLHRQESQ